VENGWRNGRKKKRLGEGKKKKKKKKNNQSNAHNQMQTKHEETHHIVAIQHSLIVLCSGITITELFTVNDR